MSPRLSLKLAALWLIVSLNCETAWALSSDSEQPIHIEADQGELDDRKQIAIYRGNVHLTQGTLRIESDTLTIYYTPEKKLKKAVAEGQPAWYRQRPDNSDEDIRAKALQMEYHADEATVYLFQKAHVWQGTNEFTGDRIEYDTERDIVKGEGSKTGTGRVHVIIRPGKDKAASAGATTENPAPEEAATESSTTTTTSPSPPSPEKQTPDKEKLDDDQVHGRTTTWLNLRAAPGSEGNKIGLIPPRTQVAILEWQGDWLRITALVKDELMEGWIHANYIRLQNGKGNSSTTP